MEVKFKSMSLLGRFADLDGTEKFVFKSKNGIIEATWVKNKEGITVFCLPTHHYCTLGCKFCHLTDNSDIQKKMLPIKVEDLSFIINYLMKHYAKDKKVLLSFMGVGEPFLNLDLILKFHKKNIKQKDFVYSYALATMLLPPEKTDYLMKEIEKERLPLKIHFSLHSPSDKTRKNLIPSAKYDIWSTMKLMKKYEKFIYMQKDIMENLSIFHSHPDPIEIHYTIIDGINDKDKDLESIIKIGHKFKIPIKILKFNPTSDFKRSGREEIWMKELKKRYSAPVYYYEPPGPNIGSSCGQFTKHYYLDVANESEQVKFDTWKKQFGLELNLAEL
jgi:23S rRNA (adenine2503-C2)-methyltransferase